MAKTTHPHQEEHELQFLQGAPGQGHCRAQSFALHNYRADADNLYWQSESRTAQYTPSCLGSEEGRSEGGLSRFNLQCLEMCASR